MRKIANYQECWSENKKGFALTAEQGCDPDKNIVKSVQEKDDKRPEESISGDTGQTVGVKRNTVYKIAPKILHSKGCFKAV